MDKLLNLDNLEKDVKEYNKLPDHMKIGDNYKKIRDSIIDSKKRLKLLTHRLENPHKYNNPNDPNSKENEVTQEEFINSFNRIEEIRVEIQEEKNIDKMIGLYLELYRLSAICKTYLDSKKMQIDHI